MGDRKPYPSDVTDAQWALIGPFLRAWKARRVSASGHQGDYDLREIVNAILYQNRTGCQWTYLPHDLPPKSATYYYFALWRDDGTDQAIHDLLRCQVREKAGRREDPTAVVLDSQSVRAANHVPAATTGKDVGKKVSGRKRGLAVDALGLIIAVVVTAASVTDFVPVRKRWIVEQTCGTLMLHRRLVREYESRPESAVSRTLWASMATIVRRLTGSSTPSWRHR
ncbi:IS5 family transposase [Micromonospora aurantiaca (nom. illeg.)]|uniref:IS5 family transposase n=1 Tax=Micromonospora aurantiaca (nom. illeg.) TaxID=47850 RepID=UPI0001BF5703|nr:IS5 family transposase [Micromonospora aurantiaca]ADL47598.1 transposase, IS4 [Micromonospora aurantiaca ATCC 27029]